MPTPYPGDPTATQAPSPTPAVNAVPIVVIPDDGDPLNVASIDQTFKTLADFAAWSADRHLDTGGTETLARLDIDGVGNSPTGAAPGDLRVAGDINVVGGDVVLAAGNVSANAAGALVGASGGRIVAGEVVSSAALPCPTVAIGQSGREGLFVGAGTIGFNGATWTLVKGMNVHSFSRVSVGIYQVDLNVLPAGWAVSPVLATLRSDPVITDPNEPLIVGCDTSSVGGRMRVTIYVRRQDPVTPADWDPVDWGVNFAVLGF